MEPSPSAEMLAVLGSIKESFFRVLPKLAISLVVLCVGWLVAWSLRAIVRRVVERFSKRISTGTAKATWQQALADKGTGRIVSSSIYWLVLLVAVMVTSEVVGLPILTTYLAALAQYLPKVIVAVAVLFAGVVVGRLINDAATSTAFRLLPHQGRQLARLVRGLIVGAAILVAIKQLGVDVSLLTDIFLIVLAAILAGAAFAFGLGARSIIANILAMHYVNKSYDVGQRIRLGDDNGRIVRTTSTTVFVEHADGELGIPGQRFFEERCLRISKEVSSES
jgi:small-conductance mechanosensitive channel